MILRSGNQKLIPRNSDFKNLEFLSTSLKLLKKLAKIRNGRAVAIVWTKNSNQPLLKSLGSTPSRQNPVKNRKKIKIEAVPMRHGISAKSSTTTAIS